MSTRKPTDRAELLQGTLDLLILRTLALGRHHGHGIARAIRLKSNEALLVETGSLYPALQRLEERGWIRAEWGVSDNNRRARFYEITRAGRKQLVREEGKWRALVHAVALILGPEPAGG
jgi:transcriptional regulator